MAELKVNVNELDHLVYGIKSAKDNINTSVASIMSPSKSSGIMISSYVERIKQISGLLDAYKQLLEKDVLDIVVSKNKITEMDQHITTLYQGGGSYGGGSGGGLR